MAPCAGGGCWECRVHGSLPQHRFAREDLRRKRHRCKRCLADKMASYRTRNPLRHMWNSFVQRARKYFDCDAVDSLRWNEHGHPLLIKLVSGLACGTDSLRCYKLAWLPGEELNLQQVHLARKQCRAKCSVATIGRGTLALL